ncbi:MFS transporter [Bartonella sp. DGB1]|uniref:MFS transporter n=1 Tax=Bartonella sp. DGB1 TaxID=3239807 RepID=UPI00352529BB
MIMVNELPQKHVKSGMALVFMILLLDSIGIAMLVPILPQLLQELTGHTIKEAVLHGSLLITSYAAMQFLFAPLVGAASDKWGRRPILLISVLTFAIDNLICALAGSYLFLLVGRILAGISGASYTTCMAYIADVSHKKNLTKNFSMIEIAFGIGFVIGPVIGSFLGTINVRCPFYAAAALALVNFILSWWFLPETLPLDQRRNINWIKSNPINALLKLKQYPTVKYIAATDFFYAMSVNVWLIWSYISVARYQWTPNHIGLSLMIFSIGQIFVTLLILPYLANRMTDKKLALLGLSIVTISYVGYAFAITEWMVYVVFFITLLEFVAPAPLRSIAAAQVSKSHQGEVQGTIASLRSLTAIIAPVIYAIIFSYFSNNNVLVNFLGMPFIIAFVFSVISLMIFYKGVIKKTT